jgi:hypothetical protein
MYYRCGILVVNILRSIGAKRIARVSEKIGEVFEKDSASFESCASIFLHRLVDKLRCVNILNVLILDAAGFKQIHTTVGVLIKPVTK